MKSQSGQTLLIVVLIMVVSLTVGLSVASRSIVNLRTTTEEENSQRAFSAAEAGVEKALEADCPDNSPCRQGLEENRSQFIAVGTAVSGTEFLLNGGNAVAKDDGADIWLSNYPSYTNPWNGNFTLSWGVVGKDPCSDAAIEVIILSGTKSSPKSTRYTFDRCSSRNNNFSSGVAGGDTIGGKSFSSKTATITVTSGLIARVVPLYANSLIGVKASPALPLQGKNVESTGSSFGTARRITYFQGYPKLPSELFQYIIFSSKP